MNTAPGRARELRLSLCWAVVLPGVAASLCWIAFDRFPFGGDASQYAAESIALFDTLRHSPGRWPSAMARALGGFKAPGLPWIGQLFLPVGLLVGSVDRALLLLVAFAHVLTAGLVCSSLRRLSGSASAALLGGLLIVSAPLQVAMSHEFMVEPLQTLVIAYFIRIMAFAPEWPRGRIIGHLLLAAGLGMLAKASTPLYCIVPGALALVHALVPSGRRRPWAWREPSTVVPLAAGTLLAVSTAAWYVVHFRSLRIHALGASAGPIALYWGKHDTFVGTLTYWLDELGLALFVSGGAAAAAAAVAGAGTVAWVLRRRGAGGSHFGTCAAVAALQLALILAAFSLADSREPRYLSAAVPYCALLLAWSTARLHRLGPSIALPAIAAQFVIVHGVSFGLISFARPEIGLRVLDRSGQPARVLDEIVSSTCYDPGDQPYTVVIGIDPGLLGDWLAPAPAEYVRAKRALTSPRGPRCVYDYLGGNFFGGTASDVWRHMLSQPARYLVMADPAVHPPRPMVYNRALAADELPWLMKNVTGSGLFTPPRPLAADPGILVFRRVAAPPLTSAVEN